MEYKRPNAGIPQVKPRVIIHGGSGHITRQNLSPSSWRAHRESLLSILRSTQHYLDSSKQPPEALHAAIHAVTLLENNPLFNCGVGAVFTRAGTIELEASVMVSRGSRKRGVGVSLLKHVRHPIKLAGEMLRRGEEDDGGGAQGHVQLGGLEAEKLAKHWKLELCDESTFWTKKRWDEHKKDLDANDGHRSEKQDSNYNNTGDSIVWPDSEDGWDGKEYLPQGTVGAVVLDAYGTIAVATSTGGITNKLPGRIGDTPTLGAGFWAEEWVERLQMSIYEETLSIGRQLATGTPLFDPIATLRQCLPSWSQTSDDKQDHNRPPISPPQYRRRALALSGTGNGDSFLRLCAVRTAAGLSRFSNATPIRLQEAVTIMVGPMGELQRSAGVHWGKTGEGVGGIIGIELIGTTGYIVADFNRAMFRTWIDDDGKEQCMVFREEY